MIRQKRYVRRSGIATTTIATIRNVDSAAHRARAGDARNRATNEGNWTYEIKFDGYRMLTRVDAGDARLITRNGHDWSSRMPQLRDAPGTVS